MVSFAALPRRRPPRLYRTARAFARLSAVVLVLLLVFLGTVAYSASELVRQSPQTGGFSAGLAANGTMAVTGAVSVSNPGFYPVGGFSMSLRISNGSGAYLGTVTTGSVDLVPGGVTTVPVALYLPIRSGGPAGSLLVSDQYLVVGVWGNATYAYLFPISVHAEENRSWGAPFSNLRVGVGTPTLVNGSVSVPVTVSFTNHASFAEVGSLSLVVRDAGGATCGSAAFPLDVVPGAYYYSTQPVLLSSGCSVSGGTAVVTFSGPAGTIVLPPQAIP